MRDERVVKTQAYRPSSTVIASFIFSGWSINWSKSLRRHSFTYMAQRKPSWIAILLLSFLSHNC